MKSKDDDASIAVNTLQWYGTKPSQKEIRNDIKAAEQKGFELIDQQYQAANNVEGEVVHTVILYYRKPEYPECPVCGLEFENQGAEYKKHVQQCFL